MPEKWGEVGGAGKPTLVQQLQDGMGHRGWRGREKISEAVVINTGIHGFYYRGDNGNRSKRRKSSCLGAPGWLRWSSFCLWFRL